MDSLSNDAIQGLEKLSAKDKQELQQFVMQEGTTSTHSDLSQFTHTDSHNRAKGTDTSMASSILRMTIPQVNSSSANGAQPDRYVLQKVSPPSLSYQ